MQGGDAALPAEQPAEQPAGQAEQAAEMTPPATATPPDAIPLVAATVDGDEDDDGDDIFAVDADEPKAGATDAAAGDAGGGKQQRQTNTGLSDMYDDSEGYYNFRVGEVMAGRCALAFESFWPWMQRSMHASCRLRTLPVAVLSCSDFHRAQSTAGWCTRSGHVRSSPILACHSLASFHLLPRFPVSATACTCNVWLRFV